ncbi:MAG TPA: hypothetical protein VFX70_15445 [Mycobacteriales bacterium]|nr:hypothetical protein [Mycobacteriales bacterium]
MFPEDPAEQQPTTRADQLAQARWAATVATGPSDGDEYIGFIPARSSIWTRVVPFEPEDIGWMARNGTVEWIFWL